MCQAPWTRRIVGRELVEVEAEAEADVGSEVDMVVV